MSTKNLEEVLKRMENEQCAIQGIKEDRRRLAGLLRQAQKRVKENKTRNNGIYIS